MFRQDQWQLSYHQIRCKVNLFNTEYAFTGGLFEYVSGANFFGEIVEWSGFAIATMSLPALAFAFMTFSSLAPRAFHHHRYVQLQ